jgi:hypothetical protein
LDLLHLLLEDFLNLWVKSAIPFVILLLDFHQILCPLIPFEQLADKKVEEKLQLESSLACFKGLFSLSLIEPLFLKLQDLRNLLGSP